ncbi:ThiF family adenylyltransferase [Candidatus Nomurabacteria bacterium]|nr:ThiF family adenylyltransferase [Candidatus Kaiserbacteria bacterium]MCB9810396.1 ThiF family adenylyltransferase [Candidatus Nomurabacteria bacterium]MCB9818021.1 ThiF family adenylyltransferase [Candidatus Nomurabacteria bacterium]
MSYNIAIPEKINNVLKEHLLRRDGQEDLCFALWKPSTGAQRKTGLIYDVVLPDDGDRQVHGNASFNPEYLDKAMSRALSEGSGIAFLHSHLTPGWQDMSEPDVSAELSISPAVKAVTNLPLIGLTTGTDGSWSARFWIKHNQSYEREWCTSVRVVGSGLDITYNDFLLPIPTFKEEFKRTRSAWGDLTQSNIMRLKIGVIGLGSVGSAVAEMLARMGVQDITLIDHDYIERHNLDRHLQASQADIGKRKVAVVADKLSKVSTSDSFSVKALPNSVCENEGYLAALDCDLLFSCVDRPWPRHVLNSIAYWHLIPVIDGGIGITKTKEHRLQSADWKAHAVGPEKICLLCMDQYDTDEVTLERQGMLDDPEYIESLPDDHALKRNENVIPFSLNLASLQIFHALRMMVKPLGISDVGNLNFHFVSGVIDVEHALECSKECLFSQNIAAGDKISKEYPVID